MEGYPRDAIRWRNKIEMVYFPSKKERKRGGPQNRYCMCVTGSRPKERTMGRLWRENGEFHLEVRGKEKSEEGKKQSRPPVTRPPDHTTPDTNMESRDRRPEPVVPMTVLVALTANRLGRGEMRHRDWLARPGHLSACFHHGRRWQRIGAAWTGPGWGLNGFAIVWCSRKEGGGMK